MSEMYQCHEIVIDARVLTRCFEHIYYIYIYDTSRNLFETPTHFPLASIIRAEMSIICSLLRCICSGNKLVIDLIFTQTRARS